jgi:histidine ammonia-lyase
MYPSSVCVMRVKVAKCFSVGTLKSMSDEFGRARDLLESARLLVVASSTFGAVNTMLAEMLAAIRSADPAGVLPSGCATGSVGAMPDMALGTALGTALGAASDPPMRTFAFVGLFGVVTPSMPPP